jgi:hypothetical protein
MLPGCGTLHFLLDLLKVLNPFATVCAFGKFVEIAHHLPFNGNEEGKKEKKMKSERKKKIKKKKVFEKKRCFSFLGFVLIDPREVGSQI